MSALDDIAETLRQLRSDLEDTRRRQASMLMVGQVDQVQGDRQRLVFDEKDASTGEPFKSPMVRRANSAGNAGNGHKERVRPVAGETMLLISPNGEIGKHSRAIPYGPTDNSGEPAGDEGFARIWSEGQASVAMSSSEIRLKVSSAKVSVKAGEIRVELDGQGFSLTPTSLQMLGKFIGKNGSRPAHYQSGVDSDGDIAIDGNDEVLI